LFVSHGQADVKCGMSLNNGIIIDGRMLLKLQTAVAIHTVSVKDALHRYGSVDTMQILRNMIRLYKSEYNADLVTCVTS